MTDQPVHLERIDRFATLSDDERAQIGKAGTYVTVPADWALMGEGASADKAYLLRTATVVSRRRLECLHVTRSQVEELGRRIPACREALESAAAERSSPPA